MTCISGTHYIARASCSEFHRSPYIRFRLPDTYGKESTHPDNFMREDASSSVTISAYALMPIPLVQLAKFSSTITSALCSCCYSAGPLNGAAAVFAYFL